MSQDISRFWPRVTAEDIAALTGDRDKFMQLLKRYYSKSYTEIDREVTAFELREAWEANASRPSRGILTD
jgi:hypothetical protein